VEERVDRHLADDRDRRRVQPLADIDSAEGRPGEHAQLLVDDEARRPGSVAPVEAAAGRSRCLEVDGAHVELRVLRRCERVPDGGDLGLGEDDARRERAVASRVDARVAAEDHVGGDAALVLAHVGEERSTVHVADRVEPVVAGNAQLLVDLDVPARLEPDGLEPEVGRGRLAPDADEDLVALEHVAVVERELDGAGPLDADGA
jgi:hypothetical protein